MHTEMHARSLKSKTVVTPVFCNPLQLLRVLNETGHQSRRGQGVDRRLRNENPSRL